MNFRIGYPFLIKKSKFFMLDINKKIIKIKFAFWMGWRPSEGLKAFMNTRRKCVNFIAGRPFGWMAVK